MKLRSLVAVMASAGLVLSFATNATAEDGCQKTPGLTKSRLVEQVALGNGATATAWQWFAGNDARSAGASQLGTKVAVVSGNLRKVNFGVTHWNIPKTADLRMLSYTSINSLATINGDFLDAYGPWNAMIEDSEMVYAPTGYSNVLGMVQHKVDPTRGYRSSGVVKVGSKAFFITGVNQLQPGSESVVVYKKNFVRDLTPKGEATFVFRGSKLYRVFPNGAAVSKGLGTVVQVRGRLAIKVRTLLKNQKVSFSLPDAPVTETRMASDQVSAYGSISSANTTLTFESMNYAYLSQSGATLFDSNYVDTTQSGKVTLRILPDDNGRFIVKNVYRQGYFTKVDSGGYIVQANGTAATTALRFKAGDVVTITKGYRSSSKLNFIAAGGKGARLIQNGKFVWVCSLHKSEFRPRSAIGWNEDGQVWLVTSSRGEDAADMGMRQGGSTSDQMGHWLLELGATEGFLLDGGGSTTMEINRPDSGWERFDLPDSAWFRGLSNAYGLEPRN